ncbi:MAG: ABC transporter substrate-binding protein [Syntrophobacteraceae bacterium]
MTRRKKLFVCLVALLAFVVTVAFAGGTKENMPSNAQSGAGFTWDMAKGTTIKVMLNQHPSSDAIKQKIQAFEQKTGINVEFSIIPESNYFDKVTTSLNSKEGDPDIFMSGPMLLWPYISSGNVESLDAYIKDSSKTAPDYDVKDIYPSVLGTMMWDGVEGHPTAQGSVWSIPMLFEDYILAYNKKVFASKGLKPPKTMDELYSLCDKLKEFNGPGTYAIAMRGSREWPTITTGYETTYVNYGATDFVAENGKLVSKLNSPESIAMNDEWVKIIKAGGPPSWANYTWYQCGADLGAGKAAMLFDADLISYAQDAPGASAQAGNIAFTRAPLPNGAAKAKSELWGWGLSINSSSKNKQAAWLFIQYFTSKEYQLWAALNGNVVDPSRKSVFESAEFQKKIQDFDGYAQAFKDTVEGMGVYFMPQSHYIETTTEWAACLQDIVTGKYSSTKEGLDILKAKQDKIVADIQVK